MTDDKLSVIVNTREALRNVNDSIDSVESILSNKKRVDIYLDSTRALIAELDEGETIIILQTLLPMLKEKQVALQAEYESF